VAGEYGRTMNSWFKEFTSILMTIMFNRCSPYRGMTVLNSSLLNLSYRQYAPKYGQQANNQRTHGEASYSAVANTQNNANSSRNHAAHSRKQSNNKQATIANRARGAAAGVMNGRGHMNGHGHSADGFNRSRPYAPQGSFPRYGNGHTGHYHDQFNRNGYGTSRNSASYVQGGRGSGHSQRGNGRGGTFPYPTPYRGGRGRG
jgi:5'-3' exoribonuclease 1